MKPLPILQRRMLNIKTYRLELIFYFDVLDTSCIIYRENIRNFIIFETVDSLSHLKTLKQHVISVLPVSKCMISIVAKDIYWRII